LAKSCHLRQNRTGRFRSPFGAQARHNLRAHLLQQNKTPTKGFLPGEMARERCLRVTRAFADCQCCLGARRHARHQQNKSRIRELRFPSCFVPVDTFLLREPDEEEDEDQNKACFKIRLSAVTTISDHFRSCCARSRAQTTTSPVGNCR
jgi:hypothetical protein